MKSICLILVLLFSLNLSAQEMGNEYLVGINGKAISKKLKDEILNSEKPSPPKIMSEGSNSYYYKLKDGRIIYDVLSSRYYLFESIGEFEKFTNKTKNAAPVGSYLAYYTHPITDEHFIENKDNYIKSFLTASNFRVDISNIETLKLIDDFLYQLEFEQIKDYRTSLVAVIGDYIIMNLKNDASWKYFNMSTNGLNRREPIIFVDGKLISPTSIFDNQYNKKVKQKTYVISMYNETLNMIHQY
jgi:hypothetical protein